MSISTEISRLQTAKTSLKTSINAKLSSGLIDDETIEDYSAFVDNIDLGTDVSDTTAVASDVLASKDFYLANGTKATGTIATYDGSTEITENATLETEGKYLASDIVVNVSGGTPPTTTGGLFTGATIPLTYKDNTNTYENTYEYNSANYNITITGLGSVATITGNGTKSVSVAFDVTSSTSALTEFTITLTKDTETYVFNGLHAHYGTTVTGILTLAYTNIPRTGTGTIGTEYKFIETASTSLPLFSSETTLWNTIYSYQVLNILIGNYSGTSIGNYFLQYCYSFNQPLTIPSSVTSIGTYFLSSCRSFNQPLVIPSSVYSIGNYFLFQCYSFNQPLVIPSGVTLIRDNFLFQCYSFNQPLVIPSGVNGIGDNFLSSCYSFNQPLVIPSSVNSISKYFLFQCYSFNQPLVIPSGVTLIRDNFLSSCYSFNQPLVIPSGVNGIGTYFLASCYSFNQPLVIPSSVNSISNDFLASCYSLSTLTYNATTYPTDNNSLSQTKNSKTNVTSGAGIIIYGTNRAELITALPDITSFPYRKLINGGAD